MSLKGLYYTVTIWTHINRCKDRETWERGRWAFSIKGAVSAGYLSRENKQEGVLICYTIKKKNSNQTNGLNAPAKPPAEKMISGKQVFPKQEAKHQLEGRSLTGNQDYSRQISAHLRAVIRQQ